MKINIVIETSKLLLI